MTTETTTAGNVETLVRGSRTAIIAPMGEGRFSVWVGYGVGHDAVGANWFKGCKTCGAEFASHKTARRKADEFLNH